MSRPYKAVAPAAQTKTQVIDISTRKQIAEVKSSIYDRLIIGARPLRLAREFGISIRELIEHAMEESRRRVILAAEQAAIRERRLVRFPLRAAAVA